MPFLLFFLPVVVTVFVLLRKNARLATWWLLAASMGYYSGFGWKAVLVLAASIAFNFFLAPFVAGSRSALLVGVAANVAALAVFKFWIPPIPAGLSFFTFTQIAYLLEARAGEGFERDPVRFAFLVSFFPKILAGPIVRPSEFLPQIGRGVRAQDVAEGCVLFAIGMAKKWAANGVGAWSGGAFLTAQTRPVTLSEAWTGVLAFTLQLYFDFSGYSDMAIGIARCFGYKLPWNFNSPYKAASMIDFWKRWHMSFTRFLTDNVFFNLPGNRVAARRYLNLMITMTLCGVWHGSGWTFAAWGALHGLFLVVNHLWRALREHMGWPRGAPIIARMLTLLAVIAGWVLFASRTWGLALRVFEGMLGLGGAGVAPSRECVLWIVILGAIACFGPNSQEWIGKGKERLLRFAGWAGSLDRAWVAPGVIVLWIFGVLFWIAQGSESTPFIYAIF